MGYRYRKKKRSSRHLSGQAEVYRTVVKEFFKNNKAELIERSLSCVAEYVETVSFAKLSVEEILPELEGKMLEDILYRELMGTRKPKTIAMSMADKAFRQKTGHGLLYAIAEYSKERSEAMLLFSKERSKFFYSELQPPVTRLVEELIEPSERLFWDHIQNNPFYREVEHRQIELERKFHSMIVDKIPEKMVDLFPLARRMKRHFVLHVGPTNSGKTHGALEALKQAKKGVYLAPLRLLAFEIYDRLNEEGVPCNMITGEEEILVENAKHSAQTIETMNAMDLYDVAVIDEGQMIGDEQRGGAWTRAILGICADEIHVCMDPSAVLLVKKMIEACNDSYEVITHERMVPLVMDARHTFTFPEGVEEKDALIVFSKQSVISVTAELQMHGIKASMIYGNLPYDVRMNEVRRFLEGETSVVVATDAIGMGLNLPIRRIVFLETRKFDGKTLRNLTTSEVKQIAGRAGRRGIYDVGYYTSEYRKNAIKSQIEGDVVTISKAKLGIPESIIHLDLPLSEILTRWASVDFEDLYDKADLQESIDLCKHLERFISDKDILYNFLMLGFASSKSVLVDLATRFALIEEQGGEDMESRINDVVEANLVVFDEELDKMSMDRLEELYQVYDLIYAYLRKFNHRDRMEDIILLKRDVSRRIIDILKTQKLAGRKCKVCGAPLSWNYPYAKCYNCL